MGMTGEARQLCYGLAVATGLRYAEIGSITPESFDWEAPSVTVAAAYTKNGDPATFPLPSDLVHDLAAYVATIGAGKPIFPLLVEKGAKMLRVDLKAAGIPYVDASGLFFDFHSLRCELATLADAAGVTPRVVQKLCAISPLELTGKYTRPRSIDIEAATAMLPSLKPDGDTPRVLSATGTHGKPIKEDFAISLPYAGDRIPSGGCAFPGELDDPQAAIVAMSSLGKNSGACGSRQVDAVRLAKRRRPISNRGWRFCRPLPYHLATSRDAIRLARPFESVSSSRRNAREHRI